MHSDDARTVVGYISELRPRCRRFKLGDMVGVRLGTEPPDETNDAPPGGQHSRDTHDQHENVDVGFTHSYLPAFTMTGEPCGISSTGT
jgi:hypothetical protein